MRFLVQWIVHVWVVGYVLMLGMLGVYELTGDRDVVCGLSPIGAFFGAKFLEWRWTRDAKRARSVG